MSTVSTYCNGENDSSNFKWTIRCQRSKVFPIKEAMLKDSNETIEIRIVGKKLYSLLKEKKYCKLEQHLTSANTSEQHLWLMSPISPLLSNHF